MPNAAFSDPKLPEINESKYFFLKKKKINLK
jgi:hypothetical protein